MFPLEKFLFAIMAAVAAAVAMKNILGRARPSFQCWTTPGGWMDFLYKEYFLCSGNRCWCVFCKYGSNNIVLCGFLLCSSCCEKIILYLLYYDTTLPGVNRVVKGV